MLQDHIQDILQRLCSASEHLTSNASHHIFKLSDHQDASLAFELFNTLGFETKLYDDEGNTARLYISKPTFDKQTLEDKLRTAEMYTTALKNIQQSMRGLCADSGDSVEGFSINILNNIDNSRRISISIQSKKEIKPANIMEKKIPEEIAPPVRPQSAQAARAQVTLRKINKKIATDGLQTGPALAKTHLMQDGPDKGKEKDATSRWLYTHIFRHFVVYSAEILIMIIFLLGLSAILIASKAFLCPDFAVEGKNAPWYCDKAKIRSKLKNEQPKIEIPVHK